VLGDGEMVSQQTLTLFF